MKASNDRVLTFEIRKQNFDHLDTELTLEDKTSLLLDIVT